MATYTVKKGDTLWDIANQYGTTHQEIAKANGISDPNIIRPGQTLNIGGNNESNPAPTPNKANTSAPAAAQAPASSAETKGFEYDAYQPSETVAQAEALLQQQMAQKPGAYQSTWQDQMNDILNQILNREKFSYDLNGDALYQQYADQYIQQGKMAMMDTMGQAQAMTGGYGNSYAQSAGQQAYQGYLQQLNAVVPELYAMALDQYNQEGQALYDQAVLVGQQENQDYGRYQDEMNRWLAERDYQAGRYDAERDYDYGQWADGRDFSYGQYMDDLAYQYQQDRDKVSDQQWQTEFDEAKRQYDQQYDLAAGKGSGSSGGSGGSGGAGGSGGGNGGGYTKNPGLSKEEILSIQAQAGIAQDGVWGPNTAAAYDNGVRPKAAEAPISAAGEEFLRNLPYVPGGGDPEAWKKVVDKRLEQAYASGRLSESDVMAIIKKLGLDK